MTKNDYTYGEILFSFREEYKKNRDLLNVLKQYISVVDNSVKDYNYRSNFSGIYLNIQMKQSMIERALTKITQFMGFTPEEADTITYSLSNGDPIKIIDSEQVGFIPKYKVSNPELVRGIVKEIKKYPIDDLNGTHFGRCSYYKGDKAVTGERMYIKRDSFNILLPSSKSPFKSITYYPQDILVTKRPSHELDTEYCTVLLKDVLYTRIPADIIPDSIREIIDEHLIKNLKIDVERQIVHENELLYSIERNRERVLLRPKNPN